MPGDGGEGGGKIVVDPHLELPRVVAARDIDKHIVAATLQLPGHTKGNLFGQQMYQTESNFIPTRRNSE